MAGNSLIFLLFARKLFFKTVRVTEAIAAGEIPLMNIDQSGRGRK